MRYGWYRYDRTVFEQGLLDLLRLCITVTTRGQGADVLGKFKLKEVGWQMQQIRLTYTSPEARINGKVPLWLVSDFKFNELLGRKAACRIDAFEAVVRNGTRVFSLMSASLRVHAGERWTHGALSQCASKPEKTGGRMCLLPGTVGSRCCSRVALPPRTF